MLRATLIIVVCLSILTSAVMFVTGFFLWPLHQSKVENVNPYNKQSKSNTANEHGADLELKENVAYITIHQKFNGSKQ